MDNKPQATISQILPGFVEYMWAEKRFAAATVSKYKENILSFMREVGDLPVTELGLVHIVTLKSRMAARGAQEARMASMIFAIKSLLVYARDVLLIRVMELSAIRAPKPLRRQVVYLSSDELQTSARRKHQESRPRLERKCMEDIQEHRFAR